MDETSRRRRRDIRVFVGATVVVSLLAIPVDRDRTSHIELRETYPVEIAVVVVVMLMSAFVMYGESRYGSWSFLRPVSRFLRDAAVAFLAMAFVFAMYGLSVLFR